MRHNLGQSHRLSPVTRVIIFKLLGAFYRPTEVVRELKETYDVKTTVQNVFYYQQKYPDEIEKHRKEYLADLKVIPIANKKVRLEERQKMVEDLKKNLWNEMPSKFGPYLKANHAALNQILDSARQEMEPTKIAQTDPTGENPLESVIIVPPRQDKNHDSANGDS
jgi:hypothetical protein